MLIPSIVQAEVEKRGTWLWAEESILRFPAPDVGSLAAQFTHLNRTYVPKIYLLVILFCRAPAARILFLI